MFHRLPLFSAFLIAVLAGGARAIPVISITNVTPLAPEGTPAGFSSPESVGEILVTLSLSEPSPLPSGCSFKFTERPGSAARLGVDYQIRPEDQDRILNMESDGRCRLTPGEQNVTVVLRCIGDWIGEPDKALLGSLTDPVNCSIPAPNWTSTIEDDDRALFTAVRPLSPTRIEIVIFNDNFRIVRSFTREGIYGSAPSVAMGDVFDGDGVPEVIVGSDAGNVTRFYVYRWWGSALGDKVEYFPYGQTDFGGCNVAAGDCGGYGSADDLAVGPRTRTPTVQIWSVDLSPGGSSGVGNILELHNEINVFTIGGTAIVPAMGELNGDGRGDLLAADGPTTLFQCAVLGYLGDYGRDYPLSYAQGFALAPYPGNKDGLSVSAGDWNGDGITEVVTGAGPNSGSHVLMYDPKRKETIFGFFVTSESQNYAGGARVAMQPRRHYSPSGGTRTLLLADAISVAHPGILYSSDGASPVTPPGGLLEQSGTVIAAWTPRQDRPRSGTDMHLISVETNFTAPIPYRVNKFRITDIPPQTRWQVQSSPDLQSWSNTSSFVSRTGAEGHDYLDIVIGGYPPKNFWRLRQAGVTP
jgi:hypothetical protein